MKIKYQEESLTTVLDYYVKGFETKDGMRVTSHEAFIDPSKGVVIFKLFLDEDDSPISRWVKRFRGNRKQ